MEISKNLLTETNLFDIILILVYLLFIVIFSKSLLRVSNKFFNLFFLIGICHFAFTFLYYNYSLNNVSDSVGFYRRALFVFENWSDTIGQGSFFIYFILYPLIHYLSISYFGLFLIFSFFGLLGFFLIFKVIIKINGFKWTNWFYLLLLPNVHFWTVSIGKDSLIYFALCWLIYNYYFKRSWKKLLFPIIIIGLIRVHILFFIIVAFLIALAFFNKKIKVAYKVILISIILSLIYISSSIILERVGIQEFQEISNRLVELQFINQGGGSSVNMSESNIFIKWVSFLFRPFFIDAHNTLAIIVSIENIIWVIIFLKIISNIKAKLENEQINFFYWVSLFIILAISIPSSYILNNLGIAIRQKTMIFPFMLVVFFILQYSTKRKSRVKK